MVRASGDRLRCQLLHFGETLRRSRLHDVHNSFKARRKPRTTPNHGGTSGAAWRLRRVRCQCSPRGTPIHIITNSSPNEATHGVPYATSPHSFTIATCAPTSYFDNGPKRPPHHLQLETTSSVALPNLCRFHPHSKHSLAAALISELKETTKAQTCSVKHRASSCMP